MKRVLKVLCIGLLVVCSTGIEADAFGSSKYEYHHIYPRAIFEALGNTDALALADSTVVRLREFEHHWVHFNPGVFVRRGFDRQWNRLHAEKLIRDDGRLTPYARRHAALIAGSNIFSYRIVTRNYRTRKFSGFMAMHFDGVTNLLYNLSYLVSSPSKAIAYVKWVFSNPVIYKDGLLASFPKIYLLVWGAVQLVWGLLASSVMLVLGTLIGTIIHPIQTLTAIGSLIMVPIGFFAGLAVNLFRLVVSVIAILGILALVLGRQST